MEAEFRPLKTAEFEMIGKLLDHDFPGREVLHQQLASLTARQIDENGSLALRSLANHRANVSSRCPTEAICPDSDGVLIHFSLHVVDGKMDELEIFKEDGSSIGKRVKAEELVLYW